MRGRANLRRAILLTALAAGVVSLTAQTPSNEFGAWVQRYTDEWMRCQTNAASTRRYFGAMEQDAMERQIEPVTKARRDAEQQLIQRGLTDLSRFDRSRLTPGDQRSADIIAWDLRTRKAGAEFADYY